jgi:hypothetical protein
MAGAAASETAQEGGNRRGMCHTGEITLGRQKLIERGDDLPVTPRERLLAALNGERPDRIPWAPEFNIVLCKRIVDTIPGDPYTEETLYLEACRRMRAECFLRVDAVEVAYPNLRMTESVDDGVVTRVYETARGVLASRGRIIPDIGTDMEFEHMIKGAGDLAAYQNLYEDAVYRPRYDFVRRRIEQLGDAGVISIFGPPTPLLDLIMFQIRLPAIYYLLADAPRELAELLRAMHRRNCEYYELAAAAPGEVVRSFEDTSTTLVSPVLYREWCLHQLQDYRDICHAHGKQFVPHMCGLLKGVLPELRETGLDGIEAVTPPPLGDTPIGLAREQLGPDVTLIGGIDPTQFVGATPDRTRELIREALGQIGDGRRFALGHEEIQITADLESVQVIPDILEEHARRNVC